MPRRSDWSVTPTLWSGWWVPPASVTVPEIWPEPGRSMRMLNDAVAVRAAVSLTWTVKNGCPDVVGVPVIAPVVAPRVRPAGRLPPDSDQLYGLLPPVAV